MHFVTVEPELALDRFPKHQEHSAMLMTDALRAHPHLLQDAPPLEDYDPDRRTELDNMFGQYGDSGWSGRSIHRRIEAIEHLWEDADERSTLHFFRTVVQRVNNETLHVTGSALSSLVRGVDERGLHVSFGPGPEGVQRMTFASFWIYSQALRLHLTRFTFPPETMSAFERSYRNGFDVFHGRHPATGGSA